VALVEGYGGPRSDRREMLELYVLYHWLELWVWFASVAPAEPRDDLAAGMRRMCGLAGPS
jgi:hypothetical protein